MQYTNCSQSYEKIQDVNNEHGINYRMDNLIEFYRSIKLNKNWIKINIKENQNYS